MATTDFTITDANVGQVLPVADGFVVNLKRTKSGPFEQPEFSAATQQFTAGRFVLRASGEFRNLVCIDTQSDGGWASQYSSTASVWSNASVGYRGNLTIVCVPKGSVWEITLSDVPFVKTVESFDSYIARISGRREPELEPVLRR
jgi:hypothetical protein